MSPRRSTAYQEIFDELINADADYNVEVESVGDFEEQFQIRAEGGTLDVAAVPAAGGDPRPRRCRATSSRSRTWGSTSTSSTTTLGESFVALGEYNGEHYGLPTNINLKSMVWYPKDDFDAAGYEVPETWDDLIALSDQIVDDGSTPWCVGFESGGATGWPATDWMEDIMLRTAGPEVYDQWVEPRDPVQRPGRGERRRDVRRDHVRRRVRARRRRRDPDIAFGDAPAPMFEDPPGVLAAPPGQLHQRLLPGGPEAGVDYDWFPFPPIDQEGMLYAGELTVVGTNGNRPEVVDFLERFIAEEVQCEMGGVEASSRISPNVDVGPDCYANDILADASEVLTEALEEGTGRFDASDLMPAEVGSGSFWTGMIEYVQGGPDSLEGVLDDIEASWPVLDPTMPESGGAAELEPLRHAGGGGPVTRRAPSPSRRSRCRRREPAGAGALRSPRCGSSPSLVLRRWPSSSCGARSTSCATPTPTGSWSSPSPSSWASAACSSCSGP